MQTAFDAAVLAKHVFHVEQFLFFFAWISVSALNSSTFEFELLFSQSDTWHVSNQNKRAYTGQATLGLCFHCTMFSTRQMILKCKAKLCSGGEPTLQATC